jgi:hypothetical protein
VCDKRKKARIVAKIEIIGAAKIRKIVKCKESEEKGSTIQA